MSRILTELVRRTQHIRVGSGGVMLLPDQTDGAGHVLHLAVTAGKDTNIYVVNRDSIGKFSEGNVNLYQ